MDRSAWWPGVSMKASWLKPPMGGSSGSSAGRTDWVMRPTSPAATFVPISLSSSVVFPWSTCASTAITGVEPAALAAVGASGGGSGLTSRVRTPRSSATADATVAGTMHMASDGVMYVPASSSGKGCFSSR